jgi:hypothetical protein
MRRAAVAIAAFLAAVAVPVTAAARPAVRAQPTSEPYIAWVQLGPSEAGLARALTSGECPQVVVELARGTQHLAMTERASPSPPQFPLRSCEAALPPGSEVVDIAGRRLRGPSGRPDRIAVLGDTGCRLKAVDGFQACNDADEWPFAQVAESVRRWQPDLVVDVGDYLYREEPCPEGNAGCAGSPYGYAWDTWEADFFTPAAALLEAAPLLLVRGDHESCARAGEGWFRYLDPRPPPATCPDYTEPYAVPLEGLNLVVMDSVKADDTTPAPEVTATYAQQFQAIAGLAGAAGADAWLIGHRPLWGLVPDASGSGVQVFNATLQAASGNTLPSTIDLVLTGHVHLGQVLSFSDDRPHQLVAGVGGTLLLPELTVPLVGLPAAGATVTGGTTIAAHGFFTMERTDQGWLVTIRDVGGEALTSCWLAEQPVTCKGQRAPTGSDSASYVETKQDTPHRRA